MPHSDDIPSESGDGSPARPLESIVYLDVLDQLPTPMCLMKWKGKHHFLNRAWTTFTGQNAQQGSDSEWIQWVHPEDADIAARMFEQAIPEGIALDLEVRLRRHDGEYRMMAVTGRPLRLPNGAAGGYLASFQDITPHLPVSEQLRQSHQRFHHLYNSTPLAFVLWGTDRRILDWNTRAQEIFGWSKEEVVGKDFFNLLMPADQRPPVEEVVDYLIREELPKVQVNCNCTKSGQIILCEWHNSLLHDGEGRIRGAISLGLDITQSKRAAEDQKRLTTAVEQVVEAILITDTQGCIQYVNPAFTTITGYQAGEVRGRKTSILKSGQHSLAFYQELWDTLSRGEVWRGFFINRRKDGSLYQEEATISPIRDESGKTINYVAVKRDVTRERVLEEQFRQSQKMEAVGRLAGGVAHDFNNLLTAILGYSEMILIRLDPNDPLRDDLEEIKAAGDRATALTRQLLAFSRRQVLQPQILDLNSIVANMHKMLQRLIGEDVSLKIHLEPTLWRVRADPGQIEQVLMNLAVNARDAMPDGGALTIETSNVGAESGELLRLRGVAPGDYVQLSVADTGEGMDEETRLRCFEPFFTTKDQGKGTGLGLSTVYGIVQQSEGHIFVESERGRGCRFVVYLPRNAESAGSVESRPDAERLVQGSETVLVVEDEDAVRRLVTVILKKNGYKVLEARHGGEALLTCERFTQPIHLMMTDVVMPQMNGRDLANRLLTIHPEMKVLYMSGYTNEAIIRHGILESGMFFIQKPFTPTDLSRKVREVLDQITS
ncbi:MAG: PAS domain S-box protein [Acidobacteriota bacterium]